MRYISRLLAAAVLLAPAVVVDAAEEAESALARYVAKPDSSYRWELRREGSLRGADFAELLLVSQTWRDIPWKHQLYLFKPRRIEETNGHGLLAISGGRWKAEYDQPRDNAEIPRRAKTFVRLAKRLRTPIAVLLQVPHQPIFDGLTEDRAIAYTFDQYLRTGDGEWPLLLPMVKSATKAMDAVQEFAASQWSIALQTFTIVGGSKRGWTTWLTGAADERATALVPVVIDMLKMDAQFEYQNAVWGGPSHKIKPYTDIDLATRLATANGHKLQDIVDPYSYRHRLTQPKLIVIGTNDGYWPLDALNLYWTDLMGPKYALYVPNDQHSISDYRRLLGTIGALHRHAATGADLPQLEWRFDERGESLSLALTSDLRPRKALAWRAYSTSRDFRGAKWKADRFERASDGFRFETSRPREGYLALFGEAVFGTGRRAYYLSSNVRIIGSDAVARAAD